MRKKSGRSARVVALGVLLLLPSPLLAQVESVFVPLWFEKLSLTETIIYSVTRYLAPGARPELIHVVSAFGDIDVAPAEVCESAQRRPLPGHAVSDGLEGCAGARSSTGFGGGFVELSVPVSENVRSSADYLNFELLANGGPNGVSQVGILKQEILLPTYDALFPAGATAVSAPVFLGIFPSQLYMPAAFRHARRLHVLISNAGKADAAFEILIRPLETGEPLGTAQITVASKNATYLKDIVYERRVAGSQSDFGNSALVEISGPQPFLALVVTEIDDPEVGDARFQAYGLSLPHGIRLAVREAGTGPPPKRRN